MAAFGEKYERPDENGYSLDPKDERTYAMISALIGAMRDGEWPASTEKSKVNALSWILLHRSGEHIEELCELTFLDYAGEVYRLAFGQTSTEDERTPHATQIKTLKEHIESASALAILVNLSDVINGNRRNSKVQQMVFLTGNLIKLAIQRVGAEHVALVFSQADKYQEKIESLGGLSQVLNKYLPLVATRFPKLRMFAVSAVGRTVVDAQGNENPPPDYQPTGLEELMSWLSVCAKSSDATDLVQARKRLVSMIGNRPHENDRHQQTLKSQSSESSAPKKESKVDSSVPGWRLLLGLCFTVGAICSLKDDDVSLGECICMFFVGLLVFFWRSR